MLSKARVEALEMAEAESLLAVLSSAAPETKDRMGLSVVRMGIVLIGCARRDPSNFWNRTLGLGLEESITAEVLGRMTAEFRARGVPRSHGQIAPDLLPPDWPDLARRCGLVSRPGYRKLAGDAATVAGADAATDLAVRPVGERDAETAARVLAAGFGFNEPDMVGLYAPAFCAGALRGFAAWDGNEMVAAAALCVAGDAAELYGGATLPRWRNRGAQTALIVARAAAAVEAGCSTLVAETGIPDAGAHNSSLDNMLRCGLDIAYDRLAFDWRADFPFDQRSA